MSMEYKKKYGNRRISKEEMVKHTSITFPVDEDGRPQYVTEQGHKAECDINNIIKKYDKSGLILHVNQMEGFYGDALSCDLQEAIEMYRNAQKDFLKIPSEIREKFENDAVKFLAFMEDEQNVQESIDLGLRRGIKSTPRGQEEKKSVSEGHDGQKK